MSQIRFVAGEDLHAGDAVGFREGGMAYRIGRDHPPLRAAEALKAGQLISWNRHGVALPLRWKADGTAKLPLGLNVAEVLVDCAVNERVQYRHRMDLLTSSRERTDPSLDIRG